MEFPEEEDAVMMRRCFEIARLACQRHEVPYAAVIGRGGAVLCESANCAVADHDATRHAELVAISKAERVLRSVSLDDYTLYSIVEPCPMCAYAIRETRIPRVVYSLRSPVMGGHSRWNILGDENLAKAIPEVFVPPPIIVAGYMSKEAAEVLHGWNPLFWQIIKTRHLVLECAEQRPNSASVKKSAGGGPRQCAAALLRRYIVDRIRRR